jgi:hypothetical protein
MIRCLPLDRGAIVVVILSFLISFSAYAIKSTSNNLQEIKIIQKWNGFRPKINLILLEFHAYLVQQKLMEIKKEKQLDRNRQKYRYASLSENRPNRITWIEELLETLIALILAPYFINVRKYSQQNALLLSKSGSINERLDSNFKFLINYSIKNSMKNRYLPLKLESLKQRNAHLYDLLLCFESSNRQ